MKAFSRGQLQLSHQSLTWPITIGQGSREYPGIVTPVSESSRDPESTGRGPVGCKSTQANHHFQYHHWPG